MPIEVTASIFPYRRCRCCCRSAVITCRAASWQTAETSTTTTSTSAFRSARSPRTGARRRRDSWSWTVPIEVVAREGGTGFPRRRRCRAGRGARFIYLTWGNVGEDGSFAMFRRAKLMLADLEPLVTDRGRAGDRDRGPHRRVRRAAVRPAQAARIARPPTRAGQSLSPGAGARGLRRYSDTSGRPASQNRHGRSAALLTPTRGPSTPTCSSPSVSRTGLVGVEQVNSVVVHGDSECGAQIAGSARQVPPGASSLRDEPGDVDACLHRGGPQQHRPRHAVVGAHDVRAHVNAVASVRVEPPGGPEHDRIARSRPTKRMRRGVGPWSVERAAVGLHLDDHRRSRRARSAPRRAVAGPRSAGPRTAARHSPERFCPRTLTRPTSGEDYSSHDEFIER